VVCPADVSGRVVYSERKEWLYSNLLKVAALRFWQFCESSMP
jgi:hypothetical protein